MSWVHGILVTTEAFRPLGADPCQRAARSRPNAVDPQDLDPRHRREPPVPQAKPGLRAWGFPGFPPRKLGDAPGATAIARWSISLCWEMKQQRLEELGDGDGVLFEKDTLGEMFPGEWHRHTARVYTVYSINAKWIIYNCIIIMYIIVYIYVCTSTNISGGKIVSFKQGRVFRQIHQLHPKSFWPDLATRKIQLKMWWCYQGGPGWNWTGHPYLLSARLAHVIVSMTASVIWPVVDRGCKPSKRSKAPIGKWLLYIYI